MRKINGIYNNLFKFQEFTDSIYNVIFQNFHISVFSSIIIQSFSVLTFQIFHMAKI